MWTPPLWARILARLIMLDFNRAPVKKESSGTLSEEDAAVDMRIQSMPDNGTAIERKYCIYMSPERIAEYEQQKGLQQ